VTYFASGDCAKTIDYSQKFLAIAREIKDPYFEVESLDNMGRAYFCLGDYTKAIDYSQQSLVIRQKFGDYNGQGRILHTIGAALYKSGNFAAAETTLIDAIKIWESQRAELGSNDPYKVSVFELQVATYDNLQKVLIAQNKTEGALEITERGRGRALVDLLARRLSTQQTQNRASLPTVEPPTIERIKQIASAQKATLVEYSIMYDWFKVQGKQQIHESELYIWVIKPTGEVTFRRSDLKPLWQQQNTSLEDLVTIARDSIGVYRSIFSAEVVNPVNEQNQTQRLQQLHQLLIEPIADLLPTNPDERVIFIPQSSLFLAPFPALQDKDGKYLIEKHTILTSPSIQVLELTREQRQRVGARQIASPQDALVVGNPTMPSFYLTNWNEFINLSVSLDKALSLSLGISVVTW
jgi:tetratricopeptide (TPR) repeat protein